jgi:hypothetical protein
MLSALLCLSLLLRDMRRALLLVYEGTTRILVMARRKVEKVCGLREEQANDERAYFTTCTHQREILILQVCRMHEI